MAKLCKPEVEKARDVLARSGMKYRVWKSGERVPTAWAMLRKTAWQVLKSRSLPKKFWRKDSWL